MTDIKTHTFFQLAHHVAWLKEGLSLTLPQRRVVNLPQNCRTTKKHMHSKMSEEVTQRAAQIDKQEPTLPQESIPQTFCLKNYTAG